jgi:hypothetical protein
MAPKSLIKLLKFKPTKPLQLEPEPVAEPAVYTTAPAAVWPPPSTSSERHIWDAARALQRTDENGQPAEGWGARIAAMKNDGRLVARNGVLWRRE